MDIEELTFDQKIKILELAREVAIEDRYDNPKPTITVELVLDTATKLKNFVLEKDLQPSQQ